MGRIRDGINSLLSRSSKKDVTPKKVPKSYGTTGQEGKNPQLGFKVFQARIYTKGERNNYGYTPVPEIKIIPRYQLRIDPPDDIPFKLRPEEEYQYVNIPTVTTPPASPVRSEFRRPHLKINTSLPGSWNLAPPSPPISAGAQAPKAPGLLINEYEYQSPTRVPPSPPIIAQSPPPFLGASDDILIHIFSNLDSLSSMRSLALTHSRFRDVLAPNKLFILRGIVHNISPSAQSLVELLKPTEACTAKSYSEDYLFSLEIVGALKALIQSRCRFFLKSEKMDFQNRTAERAFEDALYNIWMFCIIFKNKVEDVDKQMEWLRGFKLGELLDILEIWQCLGVLLRPLADSPELARKHGVIQNRPLSSNYSTEVVFELGRFFLLMRFQYIHAIQ